jgi:NADPH-dependent curcumin reductase CurA
MTLERNFMNRMNHQFRLAARPVGMPKRSDWNYTEELVRQPGKGEFLVKVLQISLDPAMRVWLNAAPSYMPPVEIGDARPGCRPGHRVQ